MILVRAPMRISFVGGGTDLPDFYNRYPGRVISTAIDKFVYIALNRTPLVHKYSARYSHSETVDRIDDLGNTRIKEALREMKIPIGIEVASFAPLPSRTGLGSSSSFSVALMTALSLYKGKKISKRKAAEMASHLEIDLLKEPIGMQDQYAAAFGGLNVLEFSAGGKVTVEPVLLDYQKQMDLEEHLMLFYTGITRDAASVLTKQRANIKKKFETLKEMSDSVPVFRDHLIKGDLERLGRMLNEGWTKKQSLADNITSPSINALYEAGRAAGAWGGKLLGAGGGGCIMFLAPLKAKENIRTQLRATAKKHGLTDAKEIPVKFAHSGVEIMFNGELK